MFRLNIIIIKVCYNETGRPSLYVSQYNPLTVTDRYSTDSNTSLKCIWIEISTVKNNIKRQL